ncbi:OmpA-OmpF porin, OOP family [bacterium A37T11]|nr:OmpA-OmpF porin, OOP family [bacterium A37T11]
MNYSTIKKAVACSMIAALGITGAVQAQEPAKIFGGRGQYRTWSLGVFGGVTLPGVITGSSSPFNTNKFPWQPSYNYGISLRKQFSHLFSIEGNAFRGQVKSSVGDGDDKIVYSRAGAGLAAGVPYKSSSTDIEYAGSLNAVFQLLTIDFLRRQNSVNFYASVGYGYMAYSPTNYTDIDQEGTKYTGEEHYGDDGDKKNIAESFIPVGVGIKFRLSDRVALDLKHTMNYSRGQNFYGIVDGAKSSKFSQTNLGLEFSLGSKDKENLTWSNPVANLYDELKDPTLRNEVEALKQRVSTLEATVDELGKDSDGDGVSDKFDKCPNTPAGTQVDGSGCPIKFPEPVAQTGSLGSYSNIQFEFDSSVLKTESYSILDKLSSDLKASGGNVTLDGYASAEGSEAYNLQLSKDRANSVKNYLVNSGVDASKVIVNGNGEANPIASNSTEAGRVQNRRVEIKP